MDINELKQTCATPEAFHVTLIQSINYWLNAILGYVAEVPWSKYAAAKQIAIEKLQKAIDTINQA